MTAADTAIIDRLGVVFDHDKVPDEVIREKWIKDFEKQKRDSEAIAKAAKGRRKQEEAEKADEDA
jgi:hypothetical protein